MKLRLSPTWTPKETGLRPWRFAFGESVIALVNGAGRGQCRSHCAFEKGVYQHLLKIVGTGTQTGYSQGVSKQWDAAPGQCKHFVGVKMDAYENRIPIHYIKGHPFWVG